MLTKKEKQLLIDHLNTLKNFQSHLFEQGHTFWFCDSQDRHHNKPFYYYQINRTENMGTCGTCHKLIENRRLIRKVEKTLGIEQTPLYTNHTSDKLQKRMSVSSSSEFNPNYSYL